MDRQGALSVSRGQDTILRFQYCQLSLQLTNKCPQLPPMYYATCCARYVLEERNKRNVEKTVDLRSKEACVSAKCII